MESEAEKYSEAWCLSFATKLHERLPRELRDLVYRYMVSGPSADRVVKLRNFYPQQGRYHPKQGWENFIKNEFGSKHYLFPAFMGTSCYPEIAAMFYERTTFQLEPLDNLPAVLDKLLPVAVHPKDHSRSLKIKSWDYDISCDEELETAKQNLEQLFTVRHQHGFRLEIFFEHRTWGPSEVPYKLTRNRVIERLALIVYRLQEAGFQLNMHYEQYGEDIENLKDYYDVPKDVWLRRISEQSVKHEDRSSWAYRRVDVKEPGDEESFILECLDDTEIKRG
jgi:hypothetical protein